MIKKNIQLFGASESCENARLLLENHPLIKRIDTASLPRTWTLIIHENISDMQLIPLLKESGINGFRFY